MTGRPVVHVPSGGHRVYRPGRAPRWTTAPPPPVPESPAHPYADDGTGGALSVEVDRPWLNVACPYCPAGPGQWCELLDGRRVVLPHKDRVLETR